MSSVSEEGQLALLQNAIALSIMVFVETPFEVHYRRAESSPLVRTFQPARLEAPTVKVAEGAR
jgi:hypothetical protein